MNSTEEKKSKEQNESECFEDENVLVKTEQKLPCTIYSNNTKVFSNIIKLSKEEYGKQHKIYPFNDKNGKENTKVTTFYTISFTDELSINDKITEYDKTIADVFYTFFKMGKTMFTIDDVARLLFGDPNHRLTDTQRKNIMDSVNKMRFTSFEIDFSQEYKKRHEKELSNDRKYKIDGITGKDAFLSSKTITTKVNGNEVTAFVMTDAPLIYQYAESNRQIISIPIEYLTENTAEKKSNKTDEKILLKKLLLKRIEIMKNKHNNFSSNRIRYGGDNVGVGIFGEVGAIKQNFSSEDTWRHKKRKLRKVVIETLDECILNKYINTYSEYYAPDKKTIIGVEIFF